MFERGQESPSEPGTKRFLCAISGRADQARTDFAAIESELEVIQKQLARLPTRRELAGTGVGIILATMMLTTLSFLYFCASGGI